MVGKVETNNKVETNTDVRALVLAPKNPLPYLRQLKALRSYHVGEQALRDAGGPVTRLRLAPKWLMPPVVIATSPQGAHDILTRGGDYIDKTIAHQEMRHLLGPNLFDLDHEQWLPHRRALQPVFTKQHVRAFAGHMAQAAQMVAEAIAEPLRVVMEYVTDRALRPVRAPRWLPTPPRRRARAARDVLRGLTGDILQACRRDPSHDAPLVHALLAATDPDTGQGQSDEEIRSELVAFMAAGHDTTATTLT